MIYHIWFIYYVHLGSIWRAFNDDEQTVIIKATNRHYHQQSIARIGHNKTTCKVKENILREAYILKFISEQVFAPPSIVKYYNFMKRYIYIIYILCKSIRICIHLYLTNIQ